MNEPITAQQFSDSDGVDDWRVTSDGARAVFRTGSFAAGVALIDAIGPLADAAGHHPDVELTYPTVRIRLITHDVGALTAKDVELARQISALARKRGVAPG